MYGLQVRRVFRGGVLADNFVVASIDTIAAWSSGRPWRWAYSRDASLNIMVSPRVLPGISTYPSYTNSRLTRGGIGAGEFDIDVGGGGSWRSGDGCRSWRGDGHRLRHGDVHISRRFCWRGPNRGYPLCFRVVPAK